MKNPEITFDGKYYHAPVEPVEYPEIEEGYLPKNVHLHFDFGKHETRRDFQHTAEKLDKVDIYIPESPDSTSDISILYKYVTEVDPQTFQQLIDRFDKEAFWYAELEALCGTNKLVVLADTSEEDNIPGWPENPSVSDSLDSTLLGLLSFIKEVTYVEERRNAAILSKLGSIINRAVDEHPELQHQENVQVLFRLGSVHESIYAKLIQSKAELNVSASRQLTTPSPDMPTPPSSGYSPDLMYRRLVSGQRIPRSSLIYSFLEQFAVSACRSIAEETLTSIRLLEVMTQQEENLEDTAQLIYRIKSNQLQASDNLIFSKLLDRARELGQKSLDAH
jgi:hypothetical protein